MISIHKTNIKTGLLEKCSQIEKNCWINIISPTEEELNEVVAKTGVQHDFLLGTLDISERAHIDKDDDQILITVDAPFVEKHNGNNVYTTMPLGMISVRDDFFITISTASMDFLNNMQQQKQRDLIYTSMKSRLIFQILYRIAQEYLRYLNTINREIDTFEDTMKHSMKNKELVKLLDYQKSMIYFSTSIKSNQAVIEKLKRGNIVKLYEEDDDRLDDTMIENRQAMEMVQIYSEILNGMMDIFATIVSNNLNIVMKFLAAVTIIISVPTMISSFLGMNVEFPFNTGTVITFYAIMGVAIILTLVIALIFKRKNML